MQSSTPSAFAEVGISAVFPYVFGVIAVFVVIVFIYVIVAAGKRSKNIRDAGHDPMTLESDLAVKVMQSKALAPDETVESRLADLDELLAARTITADEYAETRKRILDTL